MFLRTDDLVMIAESEGLLRQPEHRSSFAWELLVRGLGAPRWFVVLSAAFASAALFGVDALIKSDAHLLLGFFVIAVGMTWVGRTYEATAFASGLLAIWTLVESARTDHPATSLLLLGLVSGAVLLGIGILLTRTFRRLVLDMDEAARHDSLTGLLNTRALQEIAELERTRARDTGRPISVAFIDLDHFKQVNDAHGHIVGDNVLTAFGETIAASVRSTDIVGRVGGDEFTLVLPDTDQFEASAVLQRIRHRMAMRTDIPLVTATTGYVTFTTPPASVEEMIKMADDLMYKGKGRREAGGTMIGRVADGNGRQRVAKGRATIDIRNHESKSPVSEERPTRAASGYDG